MGPLQKQLNIQKYAIASLKRRGLLVFCAEFPQNTCQLVSASGSLWRGQADCGAALIPRAPGDGLAGLSVDFNRSVRLREKQPV
ncbi:hypothetical protein HYPDE_25553 [Hyphomicrobium denitrificans 1NES1]|uniref:Uncharacterized protein n=1 Tax=Hyphomicrobium denitrificans 1NES1 TaxID=670307 RepID=N0B9M1_9HYPH|nr:hypothetical protein HYPDE_25553 [Hyphomicrobium denitrificans 1NES1]